MKLIKTLGAAAIALTGLANSANAYSLAQAATPKELPPSSYTGDVWVDSRGCAYVRANIGNAANWVPRLSGNRKSVICGLTPTMKVTGGRPVAKPAPLPDLPAPTPVPVTAPAASLLAPNPLPTTAPAAPAAPAVIRTLNVTCPAGESSARVRIGAQTVSLDCRPSTTRYLVRMGDATTRVVVNPAPAIRSAEVAPIAPAATAPAPRATTGSGRVVIGGRTPSHVGFGYGGVLTRPSSPSAPVRSPSSNRVFIGGKPPAQPTIAPRPVTVPDGYRPAWRDGRLNPNRGPQTPAGNAAMGQHLTIGEVPMREVNPPTPRGLSAVPASAVATRSAPAATPRSGYVQVGAFGQPGNAKAAAQRLAALGLPGRVATTRSGLKVVLAGPFNSASALQNALNRARSGGFSDAFARRR